MKGIKSFKKFSRVPQILIGLVREKTHSITAVSRKDKSLGDTVLTAISRAFLIVKEVI